MFQSFRCTYGFKLDASLKGEEASVEEIKVMVTDIMKSMEDLKNNKTTDATDELENRPAETLENKTVDLGN